jgi:hypothetical protein
MGTVVDLESRRPHTTGPATCLHCGHGWIATVPVSLGSFECPACGLFKGIHKGICSPPSDALSFMCGGCKGSFFWVLEGGDVMCVACGKQDTP